MKILLVSSTSFEINSFREKTGDSSDSGISFLIGGVGLLPTAYCLLKRITELKPDFILQAGVAGSFSSDYPPGSLVAVSHDLVADTCVEEKDGFRSIADMGLQPDVFPYKNNWLENPLKRTREWDDLPCVKSITVNEITTSSQKMDWYREKYGPVTESMEGAALHFTALKENIPFLQVRSVSNMVGERNKEKWKLPEAINNLNNRLPEIINTIRSWN